MNLITEKNKNNPRNDGWIFLPFYKREDLAQIQGEISLDYFEEIASHRICRTILWLFDSWISVHRNRQQPTQKK